MHIKHLEKIFSIDKVVPVDLFPVFFGRYYYSDIYPGTFLWKPYIYLSIPTIKYYST